MRCPVLTCVASYAAPVRYPVLAYVAYAAPMRCPELAFVAPYAAHIDVRPGWRARWGRNSRFASVYAGSSAIYRGSTAIYGDGNAIYGGNTAIYGGNDAMYGGNTAVYGGRQDMYGGRCPIWRLLPPYMLPPYMATVLTSTALLQGLTMAIKVSHLSAYATLLGAVVLASRHKNTDMAYGTTDDEACVSRAVRTVP
eukprot:3932839-Rhodomonas_salina.2